MNKIIQKKFFHENIKSTSNNSLKNSIIIKKNILSLYSQSGRYYFIDLIKGSICISTKSKNRRKYMTDENEKLFIDFIVPQKNSENIFNINTLVDNQYELLHYSNNHGNFSEIKIVLQNRTNTNVRLYQEHLIIKLNYTSIKEFGRKKIKPNEKLNLKVVLHNKSLKHYKS
mmetsp:Transcript_20975/g.29333  ORF Transcript_20975/g.29333 Transcript_20975/m.29333 type:complete len:171 (-) Transcript_20975:2659-3171(-)